MLRLTLRSGRTGRFLARVVDPGGYPFVLDFGDRRVISDVSQRLLKGFTLWRHGALLTVQPQDGNVMEMLAEHFANEGMLVFLEEPMWSGRRGSLEDRLDGPPMSPPSPMFLGDADGSLNLTEDDIATEEADFEDPSTEIADLPDESDAPTEVLSLEELPSVDEYMDLVAGPPDASEKETEVVDLSELRKKLLDEG